MYEFFEIFFFNDRNRISPQLHIRRHTIVYYWSPYLTSYLVGGAFENSFQLFYKIHIISIIYI